MRDLMDKDPSRDAITRDTVVLGDLIDMLLTEVINSSGKRVTVPTMTSHLQNTRLYLRNYMNTDGSRHASLAVKELKELKRHLKSCDGVVDLLIRATQDERLKSNKLQ